jgi:hypothetical protein
MTQMATEGAEPPIDTSTNVPSLLPTLIKLEKFAALTEDTVAQKTVPMFEQL